MEEDYKERRAAKLGYKPQKENVYNGLLPYAQLLDDESKNLFTAIKTNLVKSVLAREMRPGCALWTSRLNKYIKIYGLNFSKEDHIALIKLFYELVTIPDLEPTRVNKCAFTLTQLLKKKYLLTRDDLQLEWRPLYDLCTRTLDKSKSDIGMYRFFSTFDCTLFNAIRNCKIYFPASATQEILDEFRPKLCPFNNSEISEAIRYLELFLPSAMKPEETDIGYKLWLNEFMNLWEVCHNAGTWENNMMWIFSSLARFQMGYIDWEPFTAKMFVRFQRCLNLPVNFKQRQSGKQHKIDISAMSIWIVCSLHSNNSTFFHLQKLMQTLESYFHPANVGRWAIKLRELLKKLAYFFVQRVHSERYKIPSWDNNVPDHFKLTDADIDRFVNILKPCVEPAMFSRLGSQDVALALSYLASLRPNLVIPPILDKLYASMDSLTEPHKLTSSMMAVIAVARYMVQGNQKNYPEGPTHVIPLLMALLPGIDPNDVRKSYVTFNFIVHVVNMIPLINSSDAHMYYDDLTDEEHMICEATAGLEDFVLQFIDRLIVWVESSSLDFIRLEQMASNNNSKNRSESLAETALNAVVNVVLAQCSPSIFQSALKKFYNFVTQRVLEVQVAGKMVAVVARCFAVVNPKKTLKLFLPYLFDTIEDALTENPNLNQEEHADVKFLYNMLILSEIVDGREELLPFLDRICAILDRTLHMTCLEGSHLSARILELILSSLTNVLPKEARSSTKDYSAPVKDFLPIREWAQPQKIKDLKIDWYVPKEKEIQAVQTLINKYLVPEIDTLNKYASGDVKLTRQELKCTLKIVISVLSCHLLLPVWEEPTYELVDSVLDSWSFNLVVIGNGTVSMPDGSNIRKTVVATIHRVQKKLLETDEGDTQSIQHIINVYNIILFNKTRNQDFEVHWKIFHIAKKNLEDRLHQKKQHLRHMHMERVMLQQEFRIECRNCSFTHTHKQILEDLWELGVSRYSEVRISAQSKLFAMIQYFPYSYTLLKDKIREVLQMNSIENHERFKGCLYILLGPKAAPIIARHDWNFIKDIWPLIVNSMPSEKPSIVNLITNLSDSVHKFFPTIAIKLIIPEKVLSAARNFAAVEPFVCDLSAFQRFIDDGEIYLKNRSLERRRAYDTTVSSLLTACETGNLHWRYNAMAISLIKNLVHFDVKYDVNVVKFFLKATIHESLNIRKNAMKVLVFILVQNKPKFEKIEVDPYQLSKCERSGQPVVPGERGDNRWLIYHEQNVPKTAEKWEETVFVHDQTTGYYSWPKHLMVYAPPSKQKTVMSRKDNMTDIEREIYAFFKNEANISELIRYLSLEEKKGQDQFNVYRFFAFKNLFKMFEDEFLPLFLPHIRRLAKDKQESNQRCAAEIASAIIRGSKHWPFEKIKKMWAEMLPIMESAIVNMGNETLMDWALCISMGIESRDPNMVHWLLEFLMDDPLKDPTSFVACSRVHMLSVAVGQQSWRNIEIFNKMLDYFRPHLTHPFQNIREKISAFLSLIYGKDLVFPDGNLTDGPRIEDFFRDVTPRLDLLYHYTVKKSDANLKNDIDETCDNLSLVSLNSENEREEVMRLFKTVARFITLSLARVNFSARPEFFRLLPLAAVLRNYEKDEEIANLAINLLTVLSQTTTMNAYIPDAITAIAKVVRCPLWSARSIIAEFIPVFVFYNMPTVNKNPEWVLQIQQLVLELLEDTQPEVRLEAAKVVSGLLHCQFIPQPSQLLDLFKQKARTKVRRLNNSGQNLVIRHAGVLGLCSFISAHPYDVPEYLPTVFAALGPHLSDPQPIPATIRKTMGDFKRTHHDNWEMHKLKFTEEELCILSDLTVPPSYYV
ncbi:proteasome activator complex subunit 4-like isoform X1 [Rhynchophorus ferrugineus]|uniref:proteasome activator complex subunit 4-like isoform X1 n=2 Tax=Rhynchophorus ferrugineus TaxID=354439 RepID=UPI003FCCF85F